jgi:hypothetical protein
MCWNVQVLFELTEILWNHKFLLDVRKLTSDCIIAQVPLYMQQGSTIT